MTPFKMDAELLFVSSADGFFMAVLLGVLS